MNVQILIDRALRAIKLPFRAVVKASSAGLLYILEHGFSDRDRPDIEAFGMYGIVNRMPPGTKVILLPLNGIAENLVIISEKHKTALALSEGDVALERLTGEHVWLKNGEILIKAGAGKVNIECSGKATIKAGGGVDLDGLGTGMVGGVVTNFCVCSYTGAAHPQGSASVKGSI